MHCGYSERPRSRSRDAALVGVCLSFGGAHRCSGARGAASRGHAERAPPLGGCTVRALWERIGVKACLTMHSCPEHVEGVFTPMAMTPFVC
jgi:hypothetical protein